jgi:hypothetical protein
VCGYSPGRSGEAPMTTTDLLQGTLDLSDAVASALGAAQANL